MRAALVGCGHAARLHLAALRSISDAQVVAVVDKDERRSAEFARECRIPHVGQDLDSTLQAVSPDVVHVLTPPDTHHELVAASLAAGCHVLVEKPLTVRPEECDHLAGIEAKCPGTVSVCHNYLYVPAFRRALELIRSGSIGQIESVEAHWRVSAGGPSDRYQEARWIGQLPLEIYSEVGPHPLYLMRAVLGELEVSCAELAAKSVRDIAGSRQLHVLFRSGSAIGSMTISKHALPVEKYLRILGDRMSLRVDFGANTLVKDGALGYSIPGRARLNLDRAAQLTFETGRNVVLTAIGQMPRTHKAFLRDYYARLATGRPPAVTLADGRATVRTLDEIRAALAS